MSIKITEVELSKPLKGLKRLDYQCSHVWALIRLHGEPLGWVKVDNDNLPLTARELGEWIMAQHASPIYEQSLRYQLDQGSGLAPGEKLIAEAFKPTAEPWRDYARASVIVFLPFKADLKHLDSCLEALRQQDHPNYEVLVACSGTVPAGLKDRVNQRGARLISGSNVFYRAVNEAQGDFISITGPMALPDKGWLRGVADASDNPAVMVVNGLLFPYDLSTQGEIDFESHAKRPFWFSRYYNYDQGFDLAPENFGTPLNVSFRRSFLLEQCNNDYFVLDFGLKQMLFLCYRALKLGHMLGFEPKALVWERYPQEVDAAWEQLARENRERAEFLALSLRLNPGSRKLIWEKLKTNPAFKGTLARMAIKNVGRKMKGVYAGRG